MFTLRDAADPGLKVVRPARHRSRNLSTCIPKRSRTAQNPSHKSANLTVQECNKQRSRNSKAHIFRFVFSAFLVKISRFGEHFWCNFGDILGGWGQPGCPKQLQGSQDETLRHLGGHFWCSWGSFWRSLGATGGHLGATWRPHGSIWGPLAPTSHPKLA